MEVVPVDYGKRRIIIKIFSPAIHCGVSFLRDILVLSEAEGSDGILLFHRTY